MTEIGSPGQRAPQPPEPVPPLEPSAAQRRAGRFSAVNMLRSLAPLLLIVLVLVGWSAFRQSGTDPVHRIDPRSTVQEAAAQASYPMVAPADLPSGYRPTSARIDAHQPAKGAPVTLQIGYVTPKQQYAAFVVSDDPQADALTSVLDGARAEGSTQVAGQTWARVRTARGETALSRQSDSVTVLVTGSAGEAELETVAAAIRPSTP